MTVTFKKAGEAAVKAAVSAATGSTKPINKIPLRIPRAVVASEAPFVEPARSPSQASLMSWRGWFQRWLHDTLGDEKFQKFRATVFFMPDDPYDLQPAPKQAQKISISSNDPNLTAQWRFPAPGSQKAAVIPEYEADEDPYDTGYFKKDTRRRYLSSDLGNPHIEKTKLELMDASNPAVQAELDKLEAGPESSPGNKGRFATGPTDFDPTGLRATMSVTWSKLGESLDAHMPDHLPTPTWVGKEQQIIQWYQARDLPVPVGGYYEALKVPRDRRVARW